MESATPLQKRAVGIAMIVFLLGVPIGTVGTIAVGYRKNPIVTLGVVTFLFIGVLTLIKERRTQRSIIALLLLGMLVSLVVDRSNPTATVGVIILLFVGALMLSQRRIVLKLGGRGTTYQRGIVEEVSCKFCGGQGVGPTGKCPACEGHRTFKLTPPLSRCPSCDGQGKIYGLDRYIPCHTCNGAGYLGAGMES
jgi:hypothetical protein